MHMTMTRRILRRSMAAVLAVVATAGTAAESIPHLRPQGTATQLIVGGKPLLIRGGELSNSAGEPAYLQRYWPHLKSLNLNTLVVPVYWNLIEPEEGRFDFSTVDGLLRDARRNGMHLVLLWFGSWKNSMSCYAPDWVKRDTQRFARAIDPAGRPMEILSPYSAANVAADARAYARLMRHLRDVDGRQQTVVLMQVENEIGMLDDARDHSADADRLYAGPVPAALMQSLVQRREQLMPWLRQLWTAAGGKTQGSWAEVFGTGTAGAEVFMAWHFAVYTQQVAAAGKAEYPLPMYTNAALIRPGAQPGQYPSAGPLPHLADIWRAGAPALDFLAPDIYFPNFIEWTQRYVDSGNPLFIPEALRSPDAAVNALYAYGQHDAIGFSPFGIESIGEPAAGLLAGANALIAQLEPLILRHQGQGRMAGLLQQSRDNKKPLQRDLNGYRLKVTFERDQPPPLADGVIVPQGKPLPADLPSGGIVIATGPDEFVIGGIGVIVEFESMQTGEIAGLLNVAEGRYDDQGRWQHVRWLSGDQTHQGRHVRLEPGRFGLQRVTLYRYR